MKNEKKYFAYFVGKDGEITKEEITSSNVKSISRGLGKNVFLSHMHAKMKTFEHILDSTAA